MNAPETMKPAADPINAAHAVLMKAEDAMCAQQIAAEINGHPRPTKAQIKATEKMLKEIHACGMLSSQPGRGGVALYMLTMPVCTESQTAASAGDSEGGEADAPANFATTPELQYLAPEDYEMPPADPDFLAQANRALGEQLEAAKAELEIERGRLAACGVVAMCDTPESAKKARDMREEYRSASCDDVARRVDECMALRTERDDLRARLDAVTQQSIADTDALTAQIEHLRAELAERDSHLHKITSDTGRSDIAQRLIDHNDDRLYHEADMLMYEASDAITMLEHERDQLRAELETARAEAIALKTLEGAMPGFGTAHDAQRIASLTAELQALRTSSANAINDADRLRAELATERQAREALQEQADYFAKCSPSGYLVCATKRKPRRINDGERAKSAALAAVRAGAARAEVLAVVPVGTARRGAEWRAK